MKKVLVLLGGIGLAMTAVLLKKKKKREEFLEKILDMKKLIFWI